MGTLPLCECVGLAMAICDIILLNGRKPTNFLDLEGSVKYIKYSNCSYLILTLKSSLSVFLVGLSTVPTLPVGSPRPAGS